MNPLNRELLSIVLILVLMAWVMAFFMQFVENEFNFVRGNYSLLKRSHDLYFFMMTSISMVGYGSDIISPIGRISIIIFNAIACVVLPDQCSILVQLVNSRSRYARKSYKSIEKVCHIVLIGTVSHGSLLNFLEEYFHKDHGDFMRHCILMQPHRPDPDTELTMSKPKYLTTLHYIEGSSLNASDLDRCLVQKAKAVIILSDKFSFDAER